MTPAEEKERDLRMHKFMLRAGIRDIGGKSKATKIAWRVAWAAARDYYADYSVVGR